MEPLRYFGGAISTSSCCGAVDCGAECDGRRFEPLPPRDPREPPLREPPLPRLRVEDLAFLMAVFSDFAALVVLDALTAVSVRLAALLPRLCVVVFVVSSVAIS